ncbi:MAG: adenylate/guanylate cyclase domain-containing protein [Gemmatimonadota bacterium]|nr:adenylate/guanylate cyclase domain-containing protein [Gemmatimonadota bacterium]
MKYRLTGTDSTYRFELASSGTLVCGRAVTSDVAIIDPTVSRHHADLVVGDGGVSVRDVGSSNGTFVNGVKISEAFVRPGDALTFGKVAFQLEAIAEAPPPVAAPAMPGGTIVRQVPRTPSGGLEDSGKLHAAMAAADPAEKDRQKLAILLEVSKGLTKVTDTDALLAKVADYVFQILEADRCAILVSEDQHMVQKVARDKRSATVAYQVPQSIVRTVVDEKVAVLSDNAGEDTRFGGQSILMQQVRSAICAPLVGGEDRVLGVLYVDNFSLAKRFGEGDLDFLIAFAGIVAIALENANFAERSRREALTRSNFERFFTPQLAARIANAGEAIRLGGEKRQVAVLFSDIRGFTALSETMNPDAMAKHLTEYFTEMVDCVFRHGGTLDKFIGDAVMAQWGAPIGEPDDADRAMRAALEMMEQLDVLNARWRAEGRPEFKIGIGINFGDAFAGNIGSERRLEYTVIGDTVNTASRLCSKAMGGEIIISDDCRRALARPPALEPLEPLVLKNKSQPVPAYRIRR